MHEIIETYLSTAWISAKNAAKVREIACKVAEFYRAKDIGTKPGISTAQAKQALCALPLTDTARAELSRRLDKYQFREHYTRLASKQTPAPENRRLLIFALFQNLQYPSFYFFS